MESSQQYTNTPLMRKDQAGRYLGYLGRSWEHLCRRHEAVPQGQRHITVSSRLRWSRHTQATVWSAKWRIPSALSPGRLCPSPFRGSLCWHSPPLRLITSNAVLLTEPINSRMADSETIPVPLWLPSDVGGYLVVLSAYPKRFDDLACGRKTRLFFKKAGRPHDLYQRDA